MGRLRDSVKLGRPVTVGYVFESMNKKADDLQVEKSDV